MTSINRKHAFNLRVSKPSPELSDSPQKKPRKDLGAFRRRVSQTDNNEALPASASKSPEKNGKRNLKKFQSAVRKLPIRHKNHGDRDTSHGNVADREHKEEIQTSPTNEPVREPFEEQSLRLPNPPLHDPSKDLHQLSNVPPKPRTQNTPVDENKDKSERNKSTERAREKAKKLVSRFVLRSPESALLLFDYTIRTLEQIKQLPQGTGRQTARINDFIMWLTSKQQRILQEVEDAQRRHKAELIAAHNKTMWKLVMTLQSPEALTTILDMQLDILKRVASVSPDDVETSWDLVWTILSKLKKYSPGSVSGAVDKVRSTLKERSELLKFVKTDKIRTLLNTFNDSRQQHIQQNSQGQNLSQEALAELLPDVPSSPIPQTTSANGNLSANNETAQQSSKTLMGELESINLLGGMGSPVESIGQLSTTQNVQQKSQGTARMRNVQNSVTQTTPKQRPASMTLSSQSVPILARQAYSLGAASLFPKKSSPGTQLPNPRESIRISRKVRNSSSPSASAQSLAASARQRVRTTDAVSWQDDVSYDIFNHGSPDKYMPLQFNTALPENENTTSAVSSVPGATVSTNSHGEESESVSYSSRLRIPPCWTSLVATADTACKDLQPSFYPVPQVVAPGVQATPPSMAQANLFKPSTINTYMLDTASDPMSSPEDYNAFTQKISTPISGKNKKVQVNVTLKPQIVATELQANFSASATTDAYTDGVLSEPENGERRIVPFVPHSSDLAQTSTSNTMYTSEVRFHLSPVQEQFKTIQLSFPLVTKEIQATPVENQSQRGMQTVSEISKVPSPSLQQSPLNIAELTTTYVQTEDATEKGKTVQEAAITSYSQIATIGAQTSFTPITTMGKKLQVSIAPESQTSTMKTQVNDFTPSTTDRSTNPVLLKTAGKKQPLEFSQVNMLNTSTSNRGIQTNQEINNVLSSPLQQVHLTNVTKKLTTTCVQAEGLAELFDPQKKKMPNYVNDATCSSSIRRRDYISNDRHRSV